MRFTYQYQDQTYTLDITPQPDGEYRITLGERTFPVQAQPLPDGGWRIFMDGAAHIVHTAAQGDHRFVQVNNASYTLAVPGSKTARRKTAATGDDLTAQMPGQVTAVLVKADDKITRGQTLIILEAMKMEIRITAPTNGRIQQVMVQVGAVVERGQRLIHVEPT